MKILILSDDIWPDSGGGAQIVQERLAQGFKKMGHEVAVIGGVRNKALAGREEKNGIKVYRIGNSYQERWRAYRAIFNPVMVKSLRRILKAEKPDVVHIHNLHKFFSYWSLRAIKKMGIPAVITLHDCQPVCYKKFDCFFSREDLSNPPKMDYKIHFWKCARCQKKRFFPLRNFLIKYFLNRYPEKVVAVSQEFAKLLKENKIKVDAVIYNGVDSKNFEASSGAVENFKHKFSLNGEKIVLFGGRMTRAKGGDLLLAAMSEVSKREPRALIMLLAKKDDDYTRFMLGKARKLKVRIVLTDWLADEELAAAYGASNLVVMPSICFDTFGLINLEGMAAKKPVVTSCFGGGREIVLEGESGYVINPFDIRDFSEKILKILSKDDLAKKMGEKGYEIVMTRFSLEIQLYKYLDLFKEITK